MNKLVFINRPLIQFIKKRVHKLYYSKQHPGNRLTHNLETIIEGMLYICKTGIQIQFCNYKGIPGSAIKYHFDKWTHDNVFIDSWLYIYNKYQKNNPYKHNLKRLSIDGTYIKSINGNDLVGRNPTDRGRNATKLSVIVDLIGVPVGYFLTEANNRDDTVMANTIKNRIYRRKTKSFLYGDKIYSNQKCIKEAQSNNLILCCKNKSNAINKLFKNQPIEKYRYIVEAHFSWLKSYRKLILRYDRKIKYFESYLVLAFSMITNKKNI